MPLERQKREMEPLGLKGIKNSTLSRMAGLAWKRRFKKGPLFPFSRSHVGHGVGISEILVPSELILFACFI